MLINARHGQANMQTQPGAATKARAHRCQGRQPAHQFWPRGPKTSGGAPVLTCNLKLLGCIHVSTLRLSTPAAGAKHRQVHE